MVPTLCEIFRNARISDRVTRFVRSKKEYICSNCGKKYIKWQGVCSCGAGGTLEEKILIPAKPKPTISQKALQARSKRSERAGARSLQTADGIAPEFQGIASSAGRVGHITALQIDGVSRSYVMENKNRVLPSWLVKAWIVINQGALLWNKEPILRLDPPNMPKTIPAQGKQVPLSAMALITEKRHEYLVSRDRQLSELETILLYDPEIAASLMVNKLRKILRNE